eukprot:14610031-Alexandrium_andersonii.AAC.1
MRVLSIRYMCGVATKPSTCARRPEMVRAGRGCSVARPTTPPRTSPSSERTPTAPSRQAGAALCRARDIPTRL